MYNTTYIKYKNRSSSSLVIEFRIIVVTCTGGVVWGLVIACEGPKETLWGCENILYLNQATLKL